MEQLGTYAAEADQDNRSPVRIRPRADDQFDPAFSHPFDQQSIQQESRSGGLDILLKLEPAGSELFGTTGVYFAGWLSDRMTRMGSKDAHLRIAAWSFLACGGFGALAPLMPNAWAALALIGPAMFLSNMPIPCARVALQLILPNRARAQVTAFYIMVISLVGIGVGPVVIGFMTDHVFTGPADIRYSLAIVVGAAAPIMTLLLLAALGPYRRVRIEMTTNGN